MSKSSKLGLCSFVNLVLHMPQTYGTFEHSHACGHIPKCLNHYKFLKNRFTHPAYKWLMIDSFAFTGLTALTFEMITISQGEFSPHPMPLVSCANCNGVDVAINSDDVLIFDSDVSKEYLRLYQSGCLTAEELDTIRKNVLKPRA